MKFQRNFYKPKHFSTPHSPYVAYYDKKIFNNNISFKDFAKQYNVLASNLSIPNSTVIDDKNIKYVSNIDSNLSLDIRLLPIESTESINLNLTKDCFRYYDYGTKFNDSVNLLILNTYINLLKDSNINSISENDINSFYYSALDNKSASININENLFISIDILDDFMCIMLYIVH